MRGSRIVLIRIGAVLGMACSSAKSTDAVGRLQSDTGVGWFAAACDNFPAPCVLQPKANAGRWLAAGETPEAGARAFFAKYGAIYQMAHPADELKLDRQGGPDANGISFASFTQHEGVPVLGTRLSVQFKSDGSIALISGLWAPDLGNFSITPTLATEAALAAAKVDMTARLGTLGSEFIAPAPTLAIDPLPSPRLVYTFTLAYADATGTYDAAAMLYEVDADSGAIVLAQDAFGYIAGGCQGAGCTAVSATGVGVLADAKTFSALATSAPNNPPFYMQQAAGPGTSARFAGTPTGSVVLSSSQQDSWDTLVPDAGSAVDAYVYFGAADAWWHAHGRNSFDDNGSTVVVVPHDPTKANNAAFDGNDNTFHIGISSPSGSFPTFAAALDVAGHEFTHAVIKFTLGLSYQGMNGALNESLSDVFGKFIESDTTPPPPYAIDKATYGTAAVIYFRNFAHPHLTQPGSCNPGAPAQPDNLKDPLYHNSDSLNDGGDHCKDGIPNNAWYLSTFGGTNDTSLGVVPASISLGWTNSEQLYLYFVNNNVLGGSASVHDFAVAMWGAARAIFGTDPTGPMTAVGCAWWAVGVLSSAELDAWKIPLDGLICGQTRPDAGSSLDSGTAKDGPPCGSTSTITTITDNGTAGNKYCPLMSASEVGNLLGISGLTGPVIVSSMTQQAVPGIVVEEASCYYYRNGAVAADIGYTNTGLDGTAQLQYSVAQSSLMSAGCTETPASVGQSAFSAACPTCMNGTTGPLLVVQANGTSVLIIATSTASGAQEVDLANAILGVLP